MKKLSPEAVQFLRDSQKVCEAVVCANDYYNGDGDPLYMLKCHVFEEWSIDDLESVLVAVERMEGDIRARVDEEWYDSEFASAFQQAFDRESSL